MSIPFLKQVAEIYLANERDNLQDYCFVFPNKRSATFFSDFLREAAGSTIISPPATTISDFVASFSDLIEANRYEQLFTLYNEYSKKPGVDISFDRFLFWGEMLISDFNDVDRYLVNPQSLFVNVRNLREISTDYFTDEQRYVIERFWGEQNPRAHIDHFWNHLDYGDGKDTSRQEKFLRLWEVLFPLYDDFNRSLAERGLASSGRLYRNAADCLKNREDSALVYKRYIFVGFNVLSTSEIAIFSRLQKRGLADFYWDFNSPALRTPGNRARRFILKNLQEFPSLYQLEEPEITSMPAIRIIGVPSAIGQVKEAASQISEWIGSKTIANPANAIDTAVVLPDESLFIPLIHSLPQEITNLNVTMGFPLKIGPVASLLRSLVRLQLRVGKSHGKASFFHDDVIPLLSTPLIFESDPEGCTALEKLIRDQRLFQIPAETICGTAPGIAPVFRPIGNLASIESVREYIDTLCDFLDERVKPTDRMGRHFINAYRTSVRRLCDAADEFAVSISGYPLFQMVERAVNSDSVQFVGEPLSGLQVMGVLETRALDFDNIIMLSMNERIFPRKHYTRSFIPDTLRRGYGMATLDFQESIYAYYFYRLISRARNVTLIYDARRVGGARSNEMSRYLAQLLYVFGKKNVTHSIGVYDSLPFEIPPIGIRKDERIMNLLKEFTPEGGSRSLSASSINTYINCPLEFYLRYVEGYDAYDEMTDYVDFSTFGNILHSVMQSIYQDFQTVNEKGERKPVEISARMLDPFIENKLTPKLDRLILRTINKCFNKYKGDKLDTPLAGETIVLSRIFKEAVIEILRIDRSLTPFVFDSAEYRMEGCLEINDHLKVNVKQFIDRIDHVDGNMRFVDYKTGSDEMSSPSIDELFNGASVKRPKAIMQLMLYCHIYNRLTGDNCPIRPSIYKIRSIMVEGLKPLSIGTRGNKSDLNDYHDFYDEFIAGLNSKIEEIFNPDVPFTQAMTDHSCKFCNFKTICSREA